MSDRPSSEEWEERLAKIREALGHWRERVKFPDNVAPGSSLSADDQVHPEMPCSQLAWWGLTVGVEHLDGCVALVDHQLEHDRPILPAATFTVLRGALIGSSQAALLLCTRKREQRINYGLRIAREEYLQALYFRGATAGHPAVAEMEGIVTPDSDFLDWPQEGIERVETLLKARGVSRSNLKLKDTDLIKEAAKVVHSGEDAALLQLATEMEWRLGSGSAHGRLLMNRHRPQGHSRGDEGRVAFFGTAKDMVVQQMATAWFLLNEAWRMWELRTTSSASN